MTLKISVPENTLLGGHTDFDPAIEKLAISALVGGGDKPYNEAGFVIYKGISTEKVLLDQLSYLHSKECVIEGCAYWFAVDDLDAEVPATVPFRDETDIEGNVTVKTWNEWKTTGSIEAIEGKYYVSTSSCDANAGRAMTFEQLLPCLDLISVTRPQVIDTIE